MDLILAAIFLPAFAVLGLAVKEFIRTPPHERYRMPTMSAMFTTHDIQLNPDIEYAPMYVGDERKEHIRQEVIQVGCLLAIAGVVLWLFRSQFMPWMKTYTPTAHCQDYGWIRGHELIFYGPFVGMPLILAIFVGLLVGRRALQVLQAGQLPLPGEKTMHPTPLRRGWRAKWPAWGMLAVIAFFVGMSVWGYGAANNILNGADDRLPSCEITKSSTAR